MLHARSSLATALLFAAALSCCGARDLNILYNSGDSATGPAQAEETADETQSAKQTPTEGADTPPPAGEGSGPPDGSGDASQSTTSAAPRSDISGLADNDGSAGVGTSQLTTYKLTNSDAAKWLGVDVREKLPCADWGVVVATSTLTFDSKGRSQHDQNAEYIKTVNSGGYGLHLLQSTHGEFTEDMCEDIKKAASENGPTGGEYYYVNNGAGPAQATFVFWRAKGYPAKTPPAKLEAALAAAANKCAAKGLPVDDLTDWPKCLGDQVIQPGALATYVLIMTESEAKGIGRDVPRGLGLLRKTVSVSGGGGSANLVIFALLL